MWTFRLHCMSWGDSWKSVYCASWVDFLSVESLARCRCGARVVFFPLFTTLYGMDLLDYFLWIGSVGLLYRKCCWTYRHFLGCVEWLWDKDFPTAMTHLRYDVRSNGWHIYLSYDLLRLITWDIDFDDLIDAAEERYFCNYVVTSSWGTRDVFSATEEVSAWHTYFTMRVLSQCWLILLIPKCLEMRISALKSINGRWHTWIAIWISLLILYRHAELLGRTSTSIMTFSWTFYGGWTLRFLHLLWRSVRDQIYITI